LRLPGVDLESRSDLKAAVLRHMEQHKGTERYVELADKLNVRAAAPELLRLAIDSPDTTLGVTAAGVLVRFDEQELLLEKATGDDESVALAAVRVLGRTGDARAVEWLTPLVTDVERSLAVRSAALSAVCRNLHGQQWLLERVEAGKLPQDLTFAAANSLLSSADDAIRERAGRHLSLPATADSVPLPPISELASMRGDAERGRALFADKATCAKCHVVRGQGKEVGPDLSEIGGKLSREAMFVSILDPSAGISHNYESYSLVLESGTVTSGILVSQTDDSVTIKTAEAVVQTFPRGEIELFKQQSVSLMPADLQKNLTARELVDVVEYLTTLTAAGQ
jgi:putative heme-binding domain-containing protein